MLGKYAKTTDEFIFTNDSFIDYVYSAGVQPFSCAALNCEFSVCLVRNRIVCNFAFELISAK
jgi:hypothetical protein